MNINLVGAVGGGNFGDEFILNACVNEYSKNCQCDFFISGFNNNFSLKKKSNVLTTGVNFFKSMSELREKFLIGNEITFNDVLVSFKEVVKSDIIHFIGGGYINSLWPSNYALLAIAYLYSLENSKPIFATGLGLYPFIVDNKLVELFQSMNLIDVRDEQSSRLLINPSYTGDDALLAFDEIESLAKKTDNPALILSLQSHLFAGESLISQVFTCDLLEELVLNGFKNIIIIEAAPEDNIPFPRETYISTISRGIKIDFISGDELISKGIPYHENNIVLSSRYHINLLYSMLGVKGVAVYENDYYKNKHHSIIDMGGSWEILNYKQMSEYIKKGLFFRGKKVDSFEKLGSFSKAKKELFSKIISDHQVTRPKASKELALKIINEYIGK